MTTSSEPVAAAPESREAAPSRLRRWAARRARQLLRVVLALTFVLACGLVGVLIWRWASLIGLPDVGDPFDVSAFEAERIPEDRDAFADLRRARDDAHLHRMPFLAPSVGMAGPVGGWSKAGPELQRWVESNREALALFRRGAAQADGIAHPTRDETVFTSRMVVIGSLDWLLLLEGSRLEGRGEMAEAWANYRSLLRMRAHIMRRGTSLERHFAEQHDPWIQRSIAAWAVDPRTDLALLRRALDEVRRDWPGPDAESSSLKMDYVLAIRELDSPTGPLATGYDEDLDVRIGGEVLPPNLAQMVHKVRRFLRNEPERSRRVLRLIYANRLAHAEDPAEAHRKPALHVSFPGQRPTSLSLYAHGPSAPPAARRLALDDLAAWLIKAQDAKRLLEWPLVSIRHRERRHHRALVVLLATELYRRERGEPPPSEQALVGPYLESLPDDGTADLEDGTTPRLEAPSPSRK